MATFDAIIIGSGQAGNPLAKRLSKEGQVSWLKPIGFNNTYAVMTRSEDAKRLGIEPSAICPIT
jgi:glycine betaine/choline ABC-type transport system substrate-binding protein